MLHIYCFYLLFSLHRYLQMTRESWYYGRSVLNFAHIKSLKITTQSWKGLRTMSILFKILCRYTIPLFCLLGYNRFIKVVLYKAIQIKFIKQTWSKDSSQTNHAVESNVLVRSYQWITRFLCKLLCVYIV